MNLTDVGLVNLALVGELGEPSIASMEEDSKAARVARAIYEPTYQEVLRGHPWRSAQRRTFLAPDPLVDIETLEFTHAHLLPADFIRAILVNDPNTPFKRAGKHILADDEAPWLMYVARVPENELDPLLVSLIAVVLAERMCMSLTDNASLKETLAKLVITRTADAKNADAMDGVHDETQPGDLELARI